MRGRKPLPTALKLVRGNPGKRKLNQEEPQPAAVAPECPDFLDETAQAEWRRIVPELLALGVLCRIDRAALAAYCKAWSRWVAAEEKISQQGEIVKSPSGQPIQNPFLGVANKALKQMKEFLVEFGLTPSSRSRVKAAPAKQVDPMEEFLQRGPKRA